MRKSLLGFVYIIIDLILSFGVWLLFFTIRREVFEYYTGPTFDEKFVKILLPATVIAGYWVILYGLAGSYSDPYRKSRLKELSQVLKYTLLGVLVLFFLVFFDDPRPSNIKIHFYLIYFTLQFVSISVSHFLVASVINYRIRNRIIGFPTLIIGSGDRAFKLWNELEGMRRSLGFNILGFVKLPEASQNHFMGKLKRFGELSRLKEIVQGRKIEEIIIAVESDDKSMVQSIIDKAGATGANVKVVPEVYDYVVGSVKITHILGAPLIEVSPTILTTWERTAKRAFDIAFSLLVMSILSPVYMIVALAVKLDPKGPILFSQERIGRNGKPFYIHKFRSMFTDAEKHGPALSSDHDPRITRVGKILRKTRLDEFPQFWNVLKGDMSVVGPRPERQYFIDLITAEAPHYIHLHRVRPGITSWGMVKYGYAENVEQMIERMKFDILYIENMSLLLDIKIMIYTVLVMIEGRGK